MDIYQIIENLEAARDDYEESLRKLGFEEENPATHTVQTIAMNSELGLIEDKLTAAFDAQRLIREATAILNRAGIYQ